MARTIKQVTHDLKPVIANIKDMSEALNKLLPKLLGDAAEDTKKQNQVKTCLNAIAALDQSANLARQYILEVDAEADQEGIEKKY